LKEFISGIELEKTKILVSEEMEIRLFEMLFSDKILVEDGMIVSESVSSAVFLQDILIARM
jgi:hypothetical protein